MNLPMKNTERMYSLDALRGIAALAVVFWHWQHFFFSGASLSASFIREQQPFYSVFLIFYKHGALAVDLFFTLSGFVFFWLYAKAISEHKTEPLAFFILRFSRLYPLHLVALLVVTAGQALFIINNGHCFVYPYYDLWHFALNIFMIPSIGLERGYSFNAPVWSVSVEVVLYIIFFMLCWFRLNRPIILIILAAFGFFWLNSYYLPLGRGIGAFFLGGLTYYLFEIIERSQSSHRIALILQLLTASLWLFMLLLVYRDLSLDIFTAQIKALFPIVLLFPLTILSVTLLEMKNKKIALRLSWLGDISYSSYLLHFPLQLSFMLINQYLGGSVKFFTSNTSIVLFFIILLLLSLASFRCLELPLQQYLRKRWAGNLAARPVLQELPQ
jgi:peptidoglycan/LPS O-acetylase OafA/YrhL